MPSLVKCHRCDSLTATCLIATGTHKCRESAELREWVAKILKCKSAGAVKEVLVDFSKTGYWSLEDRSILSGVYTPFVLKLIGNTDEKWRWLEDLASLCWDGERPQ